MSESRLNQIVRGLLIIMVAGTILLVIIAARPIPRYGGSIITAINTPQALLNDLNVAAALVTITDPAVVSFPSEWKLTDQICMVIRYQRGNAPTALPFDDGLAQSHWDDRPDEALIITTSELSARTPDGTTLRLASPALYATIESHLPFQIRGFDQRTILLGKDQAVARLLCYDFLGGEVARIPFVHVIRFTAQNAHIVHAPAFFFRFNSASSPSDPAQAVTLQQQDIESYLLKLKSGGIPVVQEMTAAQHTQRINEANK